jgi:hypothetical protein
LIFQIQPSSDPNNFNPLWVATQSFQPGSNFKGCKRQVVTQKFDFGIVTQPGWVGLKEGLKSTTLIIKYFEIQFQPKNLFMQVIF